MNLPGKLARLAKMFVNGQLRLGHKHPFMVGWTLALAMLLPQATLAGSDTDGPYETLYQALTHLTPDGQEVATVQNFSFQRDVATFYLDEGQLAFLRPIDGQTIGAVFYGRGRIEATPPTEVEQEQLDRFFEDRKFDEKFKFLFVLFSDTTETELRRRLSFEPAGLDGAVSGHIDNAIDYLSDDEGDYFDTSILKMIFDKKQNGLFYAHFSSAKRKPMFFRINPYAVEEISIMRRAKTAHFDKYKETICQFHAADDYASGMDLASESKALLKINSYEIESTLTKGGLSGNLAFAATTLMQFESLADGQNWIHFSLFSDMEVDSARWQTGESATVFKKKDNPELWVKCDPPMQAHDTRGLVLSYHGDIVDRSGTGGVYIKNSTGWYPRYGGREHKASFDLTFHVPKQYKLVSVGERLSDEKHGGIRTSRWQTSTPIRQASFNFGIYKEHKVDDDRVPPITVLMAKGGHTGDDKLKDVAGDMANSMAFFEHVYGSVPVDNLYATETPYGHGLAFAGMLHMWAGTFRSTNREGYSEIFRAHEVAHQWWGIEVDFKTYHDQWLSEGLSDFSGLWYMQTILEDQKKYFNVLKDWRDQIFENRKYIIGSGKEAGPIWLGYRTNTSQTGGDYGLIVYRKGAWVFHMLRMMLLDLKTMNEDRFTNMMRDFYQTYRGGKVSTADFQKTVEKHMGGDMDWFFKQWIYGISIPSYKFSYNAERAADGRILVKCRVEQSETPDDFQMLVPLRVEFKGGQFANLRRMVKGPLTEFELPPLPMKPKKIEFNYLDAVLCKSKDVSWKN